MINTGVILNNKYRVVKELGKGAMGSVYLVEDIRNNMRYAVKKLDINPHSGIEEEKAKAIFFKEVEFISRFDHPGLPKYYENFMEGSSYFVTMEYIKGETLEEIINRHSSVSEKKAIKWIIKLGKILDYLHNSFEAPIVYRDLKPANIIITDDRSVKLIDFGISRYYNPDKNTDTFRLGSPGYAAPEQYKNQGQSSPQTDVFSLGVIFFQLLTGYDPTVTPFKFPPIKSLNRSIPDELERIAKRAIELKPLNRYISVSEFTETLEKYLNSDKKEKREKKKKRKKKKERRIVYNTAPPNSGRETPLILSFMEPNYSPEKTLIKKLISPSSTPAREDESEGVPGELILLALPFMVFAIVFAAVSRFEFCPFIILIFIFSVIMMFHIRPDIYLRLQISYLGSHVVLLRDGSGNTPLHRAVASRSTKMVKALIKHGASLTLTNEGGETPLHVAAGKGYNDLTLFLLSKGADIDVREAEGNTPLHIAVERCMSLVIDTLIEKGADLNARNNAASTPLHTAVTLGQKMTVSKLIFHGAKPNLLDKNGNTPLHIAVNYREREIVSFLINGGARRNISNKKGETPFNIAKKEKFHEIEELLKS